MPTPDIPLVFAKKRLTHETLSKLAEAGYFYCPRCQQVKPLEAFRASPQRKNGGVRTPCKACEKETDKARGPTERRRSQGYTRKYNREYSRKYRSSPVGREKRRKQRERYRFKNGHAVRGVYILRMGEVFKIGKSTNIHRRVAELGGMLPLPIELVHYITVEGDLDLAERYIHQHFAKRRLNGEWFALTPDEIAEIKKSGDLTRDYSLVSHRSLSSVRRWLSSCGSALLVLRSWFPPGARPACRCGHW